MSNNKSEEKYLQKTSSNARERSHRESGMQATQADKGSNWNHARAGAGGDARFVHPLRLHSRSAT